MVAEHLARDMNTLDAAQNRGSTQDVNTSQKINWTFKEEDLKDREGWQMQKSTRGEER